MNIPITSGNTTAEQAHNALVSQSKASRPMAGTGTRVTRSAYGTVFNGNATPKVRGTKFIQYQITALSSKNYVTAQRLDGSGNLSGSDEYIGKSITGQMPDSDVKDTYTISYVYIDDNNRTANAALLGTEIQVCHPRYQVGDIILVAQLADGMLVQKNPDDVEPLNGGDQSQVILYEMSPDRKWCAAPENYTAPS